MAVDTIARGMAGNAIKPGQDGKIPSQYLPSYVDDVIDLLTLSDTAPATCATGDKYYNTTTKLIYTATAADTWGTTGEQPEKGKIYINLADNPSTSYRWDGTDLVLIGGTYILPTASASTLGGVKVGNNLSIDANGVLSANAPVYVWDGRGWNSSSPNTNTDVKELFQKILYHIRDNTPFKLILRTSELSNTLYNYYYHDVFISYNAWFTTLTIDVLSYRDTYFKLCRVSNSSLFARYTYEIIGGRIPAISNSDLQSLSFATAFNGTDGALYAKNTRAFTPVSDYNVATKKYVDSSAYLLKYNGGKYTQLYMQNAYSLSTTMLPASSSTIAITIGTDLSNATVSDATFKSIISTGGTYNFVYNGTDWTYNSNAINLTTYGIAVDGTPANGDTLTVMSVEAVSERIWIGRYSGGQTLYLNYTYSEAQSITPDTVFLTQVYFDGDRNSADVYKRILQNDGIKISILRNGSELVSKTLYDWSAFSEITNKIGYYEIKFENLIEIPLQIQAGDVFGVTINKSSNDLGGYILASATYPTGCQQYGGGVNSEFVYDTINGQVKNQHEINATKQNTLTAGTGISIVNNVISASGGTTPKIVIDVSQLIAASPVQIQFTNEQHTIFTNADIVDIDLSALGYSTDCYFRKVANVGTDLAYVTEALTAENDQITEYHMSFGYYNTTSKIYTATELYKQDPLVSGTNIKTINNQSILGSGNLVVGLNETSIAPAYDETATYAVGNYVVYNHDLYVCNTAISAPEAWTAAHWTATNVIEAINARITNALTASY